jgi:uncharacterized membrane protein YqgA involved in biofilm formation
MAGTIINVFTIIIGGLLGIAFGARLPERMRDTVLSGLGLFTLVLGMQMALQSEQALVVLASLLIGTILGEWWRIENKLEALGEHLKARFSQAFGGQNHSKFVEGFLSASILFCTGPMAILGSIQDGLTGDFTLLATKAIMDGFAALAFASTMGIGVIFSALVILAFQGGLSLLAFQVQGMITPAMITEMSAAGGIILAGIAISNILQIKKIRTGNFLPALFLAPLLVALAEAIGAL